MMKMAFNGSHIEFKADKTVIDATPMTPILFGKWKTVGSKADVITVELSQMGITKKLDIKVVSNDALKITPADSKSEYTSSARSSTSTSRDREGAPRKFAV